MKAIGYVESCYREKFATPRQCGLVPEAQGFVRFLPEIQPELALEGIEKFSHLWLLFLFHQNTNQKYRPKIHPPRLEGKSVGVLATRSPHRPNPIGLSLVKLGAVEKQGLWVSGLDLIDGTPIIDVKPYLPPTDHAEGAICAWLENSAWAEKAVTFSQDGLADLNFHQRRLGQPDLKSLIINTLKQDPRPLVYKKADREGVPYKTHYSFIVFDMDVHFKYNAVDEISVIGIQQA